MVQITQEAQGAGGGYNAVAEKLVDLAYLADGRFDSIVRYADLARTDLVAESAYGYDGTGRIDALDHFKDTTTFAGYAWAYNAANRVTAFTNSEHSAEDSTYGYDDFGQVTSAYRDGSSNDEGYTYDDNGNRTGGGYSTGAYNRITSDGTYDYEYDNEGNIVLRTRISDDYYTEYEWDYRNRLIGVTDFDDQSTQLQQVTYAYDAFNRLVARTLQVGTDPAVTGYFIYDGKNIVLALDDSGDVEQRLLWGPAVDQILADESIPDGETYWLLDDNLGTVRDAAVYDAGLDATTIANHLFYDAFGRRVSETDDTLSLVDLGYTGRYFDRATSLQWNNARWYNASIGRWMSEDWIRDDINMYRYVRNHPTNGTDPSGLAEGHHWVPINVTLALYDAGLLSKEEVKFFSGHMSDRLKSGHNGNPTYNGVDHHTYNDLVKQELEDWKKAGMKSGGRPITKEQVVDNIYNGKSWDGKIVRRGIKDFNSGVIADLDRPKTSVRKNGFDITGTDKICSKGETSLRKRGKLKLLGLAGGVVFIAGAAAKGADIRKIFDPSEPSSHAIRELKSAAERGNFQGVKESLIGVGGSPPSLYEQLAAVDAGFALAFRKAAEIKISQLEREMSTIDSIISE
jgi:RHS repeat-associated protein